MTNSRRDFMKLGLMTGATGIAAGVGGQFLGSVAHASTDNRSAFPHPWLSSYSPLDVEYTRKFGHQGYYLGHCAYGTFRAIVGQLAENVGAPFNTIPLEMMLWGAGGVAGFASFCGALNGCCAAIGLILDPDTAKEAISDLLSWYAESRLPTDMTNTYAENGEYQRMLDMVGKTIQTSKRLPDSVAGSNLCHGSVTNWCITSRYASGSKERSERCARLSGDVAAKAVELINMIHNGAALPGYVTPGDKTNCRRCHSKGLNFRKGQFTRGKMDCLSCHVELNQINPNFHKKKH